MLIHDRCGSLIGSRAPTSGASYTRSAASTSSGSPTPPHPDAPILAGIAPPPAHDQRHWHFTHRLRVVAVGAWGTVPQSTVDDLTALGLNLDQTIATLGKVDGILPATNYGIYRQRHANTAAAPRAAVPRGPPATP